jgi:hypothetical protein
VLEGQLVARQSLFLRTDEFEEAVRSLEWAELQARGLVADPYAWRWLIVALHNAAQGFMVLALWRGNGLLTQSPRAAKKWLKAYESGVPFPSSELAKFSDLYARVTSEIQAAGQGAFRPAPTLDASIERLNGIRNTFTHFNPMGWSLELAGLPRICLDTLDLLQFLGWESTAIRWPRRVLVSRAKRALKLLRRNMVALEVGTAR